MTDRELMQMALDALVLNNKEWEELADQSGRWKAEDQDHYHHTELTIKAMRDRLAQSEPKPVAWLSKCYNDDNEFIGYTLWDRDVGEGCFPVYTAPKEKNA